MADPQQSPVPVPLGAFYTRAYGSSSVYIGVPAIAAGGSALDGTGTFTATIPGIGVNDLLILEPPAALAGNVTGAGANSVSYAGFKITAANTVVVYFTSGVSTGIAAQTAVPWVYKWIAIIPATVLAQNPT